MDREPPLVELGGGVLRLDWPGVLTLDDVRPVCRLTGGSVGVQRGEAWSEVEGGGAAGERCFRSRAGPLDVELRLRNEAGGIVSASVLATADARCQVAELGLEARPRAPEGELWLLYSGYQSWDRAGVFRLGSSPYGVESWWTACLCGPEGAGLALAAGSCARSCRRFEVRGEWLSLLESATPRPDPMAVWEPAEGERWEGEPLLLASGARADCRLGDLLRRQPHADAVKGWLSWYQFGSWVGSDDVHANSAALQRPEFAQAGYRVVQLDDGWQQAYGDWEPNARFPEIEQLAARLEAAGQVAGIWTAPFLVGVDSSLAGSAPEHWFLRDPAGGRLIDPREGLPGQMYVLDSSEPEVQAHLARVFQRLREAGFRYFKVDYLYAGAFAGLSSFRRCLAAIRDAIGDAYLLACGAPLMPVAGLADGIRIGEDIARPIYNFETGLPQPTIFGEEVQWTARNLAARRALSAWAHLDVDIALVGGNLRLGQARQLVTVAVLSGGPLFAGDDLPRLSPERIELLTNPEVLKLAAQGPATPDWEPNDLETPPAVWRLDSDVLAVFNWSQVEREFEIPLEGRIRLRDLWQREDAGSAEGELRVRLPPDGVRLLSLTSR